MARKRKMPNKYENTLLQSLDQVNRGYSRHPSRYFEIGDEVVYGAWDWSAVLEVCENGKYYKLISVTKEKKGPKFKIHYEMWHNLLLASRKQMDFVIKETDDIHIDYSQTSLDSLLHRYYTCGIDLSPDYQRGNVWSESQKIDLIDSIFRNIDIGKFALIKRDYGTPEELYESLDGKQRISALLDFYEDKLVYRGLLFSEMNFIDRNHFLGFAINIGYTSHLTQRQKYMYFLKLNTAGQPMAKEHLDSVKELLQTAS